MKSKTAVPVSRDRRLKSLSDLESALADAAADPQATIVVRDPAALLMTLVSLRSAMHLADSETMADILGIELKTLRQLENKGRIPRGTYFVGEDSTTPVNPRQYEFLRYHVPEVLKALADTDPTHSKAELTTPSALKKRGKRG